MTLGCALALPAVLSLATLASLDVEAGLRAEGRTSTLKPSGSPAETRGALLATPSAGLRLDGTALRLEARYAPRIWTSDVEAEPSPLVTHEAALSLETRGPRTWRAEAGASAARGRTDPLADPVQALAAEGLSEAATLDPIPFEALRAHAGGTLALGLRTTLDGVAAGWRSGGVDAADRLELPVQRGASAELSLARLASVRDTLRLRARALGTITAAVAGEVTTASASASAGWRRRLTPALDGWLEAGAALWTEERDGERTGSGTLPVGEGGLAWDRGEMDVELAAQVAPYADRIEGTLDPMVRGRATVRWRTSPRLTFVSSASGGSLLNGETALAALDARARYDLGERLALEAGVVGRWQRDRGRGLPTFAEGGVVLAIAWSSARTLAAAPPAGDAVGAPGEPGAAASPP